MPGPQGSILQYLNQLRPATTDPELIYSPEPGEQVVLVRLIVANVSNKNRDFSVYFDHDGTTADETTAIAFEAGILKNTTEIIDLQLPARNSAGGLYVQTDKANDLNFTLTGLK